ncbi:MAG TPA: peptide deformylase [Chloroflexota bacterium]
MALRRIVQLGEPILRQKAKKVHRIDPSIKQLIDDMVETMIAAPGVGLAAPQVNVPLRIIVTNVDDRLRVLINPEVVEASDETEEGFEGCLSMPGWIGPVDRATGVTVRGLNKSGKSVKVKAEAWEARCLQHEIDHLNGVMFIDRIEDKSRLERVESQEEEEELEEEQVFA